MSFTRCRISATAALNSVAAPFANGGAEIGEGEFNASATIVAAFQ